MRAVVVYESMFGNTHQVAQAIGEGMAETMTVAVSRVSDATDAVLDGADLIVAGGPTHVHGMSQARTRAEAHRMAADSEGKLHLDDGAAGVGVREWLENLPRSDAMAAAFDTRTDIPRLFSGAASSRIDHTLRAHGLRTVAAPMSFLVDSANRLEPSELARARAWGIEIAHEALSIDAAHAAATRH